MSISDVPRLQLAELRQLLRAADPAALLVPPRVLRRVIKRQCQLTSLGLRVPHARSFVLDLATLLTLADRDELGIEPDRKLPSNVLLLASPDPARLAEVPRDVVLLDYWRLLFHARVHATLAERVAAGKLSRAMLRQRIHQIGQTEFDEVRTVLRQEKYLLPPREERTVYEEFAAVYLELRYFAGTLLPRYFPALADLERIDRILAEDVDAVTLFAATRLGGAPTPVFPAEDSEPGGEACLESASATTLARAPSTERYRHLLDRAERAAATGNVVRAALCRAQAADLAPEALAGEVQSRARAELHQLAERLQHALHLSGPLTAQWHAVLPALLPGAARGVWPAEARLLYDLQKVCVDHERPLYKPDLVEWAYSFFREPLVRPLPHQPLVLAVKHLRGAVYRLPSLRVADAERHTLSELLHHALHHAEERLREHFRPLLGEVLREVGLQAQNFPEHIARDKLIEELLDRISEHGFLTLGDVRDALSRNELKLGDLSGPGELITGDPLLRANRVLAARAVGVYRRGEVYLRAMQRTSALAFGTKLGRWLTLFVALPFGAAYGAIVFVQEMLHLVHLPHHLTPVPLGLTIGVLGVFFLLLLHQATFRAAVVAAAHAAGAAVRHVAVDLPVALWQLPLVRRLLASRPFLVAVRYGLKPLPVSVPVGMVLWAAGGSPVIAVWVGIGLHLAVSLLLNSRLGRDLEEALIDGLVRKWEYLHDLLPGLYHLILDVFRWLLQQIERYLYTVDEWLRFRSGQGRLTLVAKTVLGFGWFLFAYLVRLYVIVFIEPTVNPLKHFPAVTVAAKMLVPFWIPLTELFAAPIMFLGPWLAYGIAFLIVHAIPGTAGFLVWELKENWRLYRTNRPRDLKPTAIGHHGETLLRLLKPGFHSGTLPKLYAKLRRAERKAQRGASWQPVRKLREGLHEIEEVLRHFTERELLAFINRYTGWSAGPLHLATVEAGSNRIRLALACPALGTTDLDLRFEEQSGWLLAGIAQSGWLAQISPDQQAIVQRALLGFFKRAGVDLLREQIEASFPPPCPPYDIADEGLVLWPGDGYETMVVYDLHEEPTLPPRVVEGKPTSELPVLEAGQLLFRKQAVAWPTWVRAWETAGAGPGSAR